MTRIQPIIMLVLLSESLGIIITIASVCRCSENCHFAQCFSIATNMKAAVLALSIITSTCIQTKRVSEWLNSKF